GDNGSVLIARLDGTVELEKRGADGRGIWELIGKAPFAAVTSSPWMELNMNSIERLRDLVAERFPTATFVLDAPDTPDGFWWLDIYLSDYHVAVEWRPGQGFGLSTPSDDDYGPGADEIHESATRAFERVRELVLSQTKTRKPVDLPLPRLRESLQLTQAEIVRRLQINQATLSRMERRSDMFIGTLRNLVEGLGGSLELIARFPEATVRIHLDDEPAAPRSASVA
ncbi:MAG TPA: XRE family transcriptional regulator, partial [Longimicrobium sp.]|nr:XRE family transcriptional regulator [Longimicrobium sp.]